MKRHHWLIIIIASLLGMFFVPKAAYSAQLENIPTVIIPRLPIAPVTLPGQPLPIPTAIPGPAVNLPNPAIPLAAVRDSVKVVAFVAPREENKGLFAAAQKAFAAAPGQTAPSSAQLNSGFDQGSKPSASSKDGAVDGKDLKKDQPKRRRTVEKSRVIQVPTWELENELGI